MPRYHFDEFVLSAPTTGSLEDTSAVVTRPPAEWGNGALSPAFDFEGSGGPSGTFDWHIAPNSEVVLDTVSTLIFGGRGGVPSSSQLVVNGVVNLRNLVVPASSRLRIQGPNPARILCSGTVENDGVSEGILTTARRGGGL